MATTDKLKQRIAAFAQELASEMGQVDESEALSWLDAIESQAVEISDAVHRELVEQRAAAPQAVVEEATCPECGKRGRYQGQRKRALIGRRGPITIREVEYYCPCCRKAFFPDDQADRG